MNIFRFLSYFFFLSERVSKVYFRRWRRRIMSRVIINTTDDTWCSVVFWWQCMITRVNVFSLLYYFSSLSERVCKVYFRRWWRRITTRVTITTTGDTWCFVIFWWQCMITKVNIFRLLPYFFLSQWEGLKGVFQEGDNHQGDTNHHRRHLVFCYKIVSELRGTLHPWHLACCQKYYLFSCNVGCGTH